MTETERAKENQLRFTAGRLFQDCPYFPCHQGEKFQSCLFCFCPFYPCETKNGKRLENGIWDCSQCTFIHSEETVFFILNALYDGKSFSQIKESLFKEERE